MVNYYRTVLFPVKYQDKKIIDEFVKKYDGRMTKNNRTGIITLDFKYPRPLTKARLKKELRGLEIKTLS